MPVSREKLFSTPVITGILSQIDVPGSLFQRFYGLGPGGAQSRRIQGRTASWDLFHSTRSIAKVSGPMAPAAQRSRKPYGTRTAALMRVHEKMTIHDEILMRYRPAGAAIGTIDDRGTQYVRDQLGYFSQVFKNTREYAVSRMFRGGFGLKESSDGMVFTTRADGTKLIDVDMGIPATHFDQLNLAGMGGNVIDASWATASTDIVSQFMRLDVYAERVNGRPTRHIWVNGNTARYLFENTQLASIRGTSVRIFDSLTRREIDPASKYPDTGFDLIFGAMPLHIFHVYNGGLVAPGTAEDFDSQISNSNFEMFIPDNVAIITPEPGTWCGVLEGSEYIREREGSEMQEIYGMGSWSRPVLEPSGQEVYMLDNFLPVIYEPYAIYYATVIF